MQTRAYIFGTFISGTCILGMCILGMCILGACGGGGGSGGILGQPVNAVTIDSDATFDAYLNAAALINRIGSLKVGDEESLDPSRDFRSFVSFDLSSRLPAGATVVSATLRCYLVQVTGAPYVSLGNVLAIHVALGPTLETTEFTGGEIMTAGTLSSSPAAGWKELDVTSRVLADLAAGRTRTQFRLQCAIGDGNGDGADTLSEFESGDNTLGTGRWPELRVSYTTP